MQLSFRVGDGYNDQTAGTTTLHAGGLLCGSLIISTTKSVRATHLALYFRGKEYTTVQYKKRVKHGDHYRTETKTATAKHQLMRLNIAVPNESSIIRDGKVSPGNYEVAFGVPVPSGIPSSMFVSKVGEKASIAYCLRAVLKGSGSFQDYQARQEVTVVAEPEPVRTVPYLMQPESQVISTCSCCPLFATRGDITYGAKLLDTQLLPGQQIQVRLALMNDSPAALSNINMQLREVVRWSAHSHHTTFARTLCTATFPQNRASNFDKQSVKARLQETNRRQDNNYKILQQLGRTGGGNEICTLPPIPEIACNTYQGPSIKITHELMIRIITESDYTNPEFFLPVKIARGGGDSTTTTAESSPSAPEVTPAEIPVATAEPFYENDNDAPSSNPNYHPNASAPPMKFDDHVYVPPSATNPEFANQLPNWDGPFDETTTTLPSVEQLLDKMKYSVDDLSIVQHRIKQSNWKSAVFSAMTPTDFGRILEQVHLDVNLVSVATLVATNIDAFTCQHVVKALPSSSSSYRCTLVEQLIPYCQDFQENHTLIIGQLSDWDTMATESAFQSLLQQQIIEG